MTHEKMADMRSYLAFYTFHFTYLHISIYFYQKRFFNILGKITEANCQHSATIDLL